MLMPVRDQQSQGCKAHFSVLYCGGFFLWSMFFLFFFCPSNCVPLFSTVNIIGWFSNRTRTSVDDGAHKSNNWLDQWQNGKLNTWSHVQSFLRAFPLSTDVPVLLLNQPSMWQIPGQLSVVWGLMVGLQGLPAVGAVLCLGASCSQWRPPNIPGTHLPYIAMQKIITV